MSNVVDSFFKGMIVGVVVTGIAGLFLDMRHNSIFKEEAVAAGAAEWIIETNESGEPEMKFQWKQLK